MLTRRILSVIAVVLLFAGSVFAFPYDQNPSTIQAAGGGIPGFGGFDGNWVSNFSAVNVDNLRLYHFKNTEFFALGGPGGATDMKIWGTPSFAAERKAHQALAYEYAMNNPGRAISSDVARCWYTTHDEMVDFIEKLPRTNLTIEYLGEIPRGFPFPFMIFSKGNQNRTPAGLAATGKALVWIQGNIHGNETSGPEGLLALVYNLATGKYDNYLDKVNVVVVPRVCADGAKGMRRETRDLLALQWTPQPEARDLNRDNMLLDLQVTRAMRKMFLAYGPHFCVDLHEWGGSGTVINNNITSRLGIKIDNAVGDITASGTTIIQAPRDLIRIRYEYTEPDIAKMAPQYGIYFGLYSEGTDTIAHGSSNNYATSWPVNGGNGRWNALPGDKWPAAGATGGPYAAAEYSNSFVNSTAWDPDAPYLVIPEAYYNNRSSRNINSMPGVVSLLFENKVMYLGRYDWERRIAAGYICMISTIKTAAEKGDEIIPKITEIRKKMVEQGKTVTEADKIPILVVQPRPTHWNAGSDAVRDASNNNYLANFGYKGREAEYSVVDFGLATVTDPRDISALKRYDGTKSLAKRRGTTVLSSADVVPVYGRAISADYEYHQPFKFEATWLGWPSRERIRPYAYLIEGPYANELVTRMMLAGIDVKRLAKDVTIEVEGWKYNRAPYIDLANSGTSGWGGRDIDMYKIQNRVFKKDTFVVYLGQLASNLIPMYMEPDLPWNVASCIFIPYMSVAAGGNSTGNMHDSTAGVEMPAYRYLKEVDLPTYDMNHYLPLVNRGAAARFFAYPTQEDIKDVSDACGEKFIRVYNYDFQVHTRTDALVNGKFDISLPTNKDTKGYLILGSNGTYAKLNTNSTMMGWNIGTVVVADHGLVPFTVNLSDDGRPVVGDGSNRTLPRALPANDDLIGVRIVEVFISPILMLFKDNKLPLNAVETADGFEYTEMLASRSVLLSNAMLDGWHISAISPDSGTNWKASIVNGELVVTFLGDVYDQKVKVTLTKDGGAETATLNIVFSGEKHRSGGCNAGAAVLALFALFPFLMRRKD